MKVQHIHSNQNGIANALSRQQLLGPIRLSIQSRKQTTTAWAYTSAITLKLK